MTDYIEYPNREKWLEARQNSIGASEVGILLGYSHYKDEIDLWQEKTSRAKPTDISSNPQVAYGTEAEQHLRALFALKHKEYRVEYHPYRVYHRSEHPYITATLDGEIFTADGKRGIWECKTALIQTKEAYACWKDNHIPDMYYAQLCQQMYVTSADFAVLNAELRFPDNTAEIVERTVTYKECESDILCVAREAINFWDNYIKLDRRPSKKFVL